MARIVVIAGSRDPLAINLADELQRQRPSIQFDRVAAPGPSSGIFESCIYVPSLRESDGMVPDLALAEQALLQSSQLQYKKFILLSSALVYGTGPGRQSLVKEDSAAVGA